MNLNVGNELAALNRMTVGELRTKYAEVHGETTNTRHKQWLVRRIIWRLQALAEGDLSERARRRAAELANDADLWVTAPKAPKPRLQVSVFRNEADSRLPIPGTLITREYKGKSLQVQVLTDGLEFEGVRFKSLSAVAKAITGSHCNGCHFFRLRSQAGGR